MSITKKKQTINEKVELLKDMVDTHTVILQSFNHSLSANTFELQQILEKVNSTFKSRGIGSEGLAPSLKDLYQLTSSLRANRK